MGVENIEQGANITRVAEVERAAGAFLKVLREVRHDPNSMRELRRVQEENGLAEIRRILDSIPLKK